MALVMLSRHPWAVFFSGHPRLAGQAKTRGGLWVPGWQEREKETLPGGKTLHKSFANLIITSKGDNWGRKGKSPMQLSALTACCLSFLISGVDLQFFRLRFEQRTNCHEPKRRAPPHCFTKKWIIWIHYRGCICACQANIGIFDKHEISACQCCPALKWLV